MRGTWSLSWHSIMLTLLLHIVLYALVFLVCAFFAARQFRRMRNPERKSLRASQDKSVEGGDQADKGEDTLSQELLTFAGMYYIFMGKNSYTYACTYVIFISSRYTDA